MYPDITLQLYDGEQHELMHGLHRGRFDLALVYDLELGHSINKEMLNAPHKPYALLPASHPLAQKNSVTLQELSHEPMILLDAVPSKIILSPYLKRRAITLKSPTVHPPSKWCAVWWDRDWGFRY
jgi:DNA-binding transcriptional LysR family regulator